MTHEVVQMTENEYNYLMTLYLGSDYCEAMPFYEYAMRYGKYLIGNRGDDDGGKKRLDQAAQETD